MEKKITAAFRLSPQQQYVWSLFQRDSALLRVLCAVLLDGSIDVDTVRAALTRVVARHEILRTIFKRQPGMKVPFQVIRDKNEITQQGLDFTYSETNHEAEVQQHFTEMKRELLDLVEGPVLHARLLKTESQKHALLLTCPALCADSGSLQNLAAEIVNSLRGPVGGDVMQYADVSEWQHGFLESGGEQGDKGKEFWQKQLAGGLAVPILPLESKARDGAEFEPEALSVRLSKSVASQIDELAEKLEISPADVLLASWQTLLSKLSGQPRSIVHTLFPGREYEELQGAVGLFARYLPVRARFDSDFRFREIVEQIQSARAQAVEFQEYFAPGSAHGQDETVAFDYDEWAQVSAGDLRASLLRHWVCTDRYKLKLACVRANGSLQLELHYDSSRYGQQAIEQLARCFETLLAAAVANPEALASSLPLLGDEEHRRIATDWNQTAIEYSREQTIADLFEQQAAKTPGRVALVCNNQQLTYAELNRWANQLAHHLRKLGVGPDALVGLCLERSAELMVALLAILKAGGAYVPLNPDNPPARTAQQLAGVHVLITQETLLGQIPSPFSGQTLCMDRDRGQWVQESDSNLPATASPENLVYVIYTSGSTGVPKGVAVRHRNLVNYSEFICRRLELEKYSDGLNFATVSTIGADLGNTCIYPSLISGGTLHLVSYEVATDSRKLAEYNERHQIDVLKIVPSHLGALLNSEEGVRVLPRRFLILGGEALSWALVDKIRATKPTCEIINHYGPTETTVGSLTLRLAEVPQLSISESATVPIGRPISNTQVYILDQHLAPMPVGVAGELYIGGEGVTAGYLNQPEKTAERFIPDPFTANHNARLYRTGDLARYLPDGQVEFLGRGDDQVKVRGFRIELGEVEAVLAAQPGVKQVAVLARQEKDTGEKRLVAYLVTSRDNPPTTDSVRQKLREQLPDYMVPSALVILDKLPLNANGKVDRKALPAPEDVQEQARPYVAPRTPIEEVVSNIWAEVLHREQVGAEDNFFDLGGHSLLATQVVSRVRRVMSVELPLRALFEAPTVAQLASRIEIVRREKDGLLAPPIERIPRDGELPLSFAQQRLWFVNQLDPQNPAYNVPRVIRIRGELNPKTLEKTINAFVQRHESMRTRFPVVQGRAVQIIAPELHVPLKVVDVPGNSAEEREARTMQLASEEALQPFDLANGPLVRSTLLRLEPDHYVLLLDLHHIISDGWTKGVMFEELGTLYEVLSQGKPSPLPDLPIQYADYAMWQRRWLQGEVLEKQLSYWKEELEGAAPFLELPTDRPRPAVESFRGTTETVVLPNKLRDSLKALSRREGTTLFMTLLAAFNVLLSRYTGQEDIVVGSPIANRNRTEIEGLIGFFVNSLVLRTNLSGDPSFRELMGRVREVALGAYAHQDLPFEKLVEEISPERSLSYNPLFQVAFALQNAPQAPLQISGLSLSDVDIERGTTKFDIAFSIVEQKDGLVCVMEYATDLFDASTIRRMLGRFSRLLDAAATNPEQAISQLPLLDDRERQQVVVEWNKTQATLFESNVVDLFEEHAKLYPQALAAACNGQQLTYAELNQRSNQLSHMLSKYGVGPEAIVGICTERSLETLVGILGVVKAGGVYLPLDPAYPKERLEFILRDSQAKLLLTQESLLQLISASTTEIICLDIDWDKIAVHSVENPPRHMGFDNLAYVIYTSGSTGKPKGVEIPHRGLSNLVSWHQRTYSVTAADRATMLAGLAFDASVWELWPYITAGASIHLPDEDTRATPSKLVGWLAENRITLTFLPTPLAEAALEETWPEGMPLRALLTGGDKLHRAPRREMSFEVINHYGPTENSVVTTCAKIPTDSEFGMAPPIGRPIDNVRVYVLDAALQPVPVGVPGELHIGGSSLARGYLNRPDLTSEKFVCDPFSTEPGARLYKTGDRVRYRPDGNLEFLGRIDQQVKLRGFRIELGEIEAVIAEHPGIRQSLVTIKTDEHGNSKLVAYVVPNPRFQTANESKEKDGQTTHVTQWETTFDEAYGEGANQPDLTFNIIGWNSSYTGLPIPPEEMREWLETSVTRILSFSPERVLEIGCGTGLLLFRLAGHCRQYWGTDISSTALSYIQTQLPSQNLSHVQLQHRAADNFSGLEAGEFDTVVLNSIVQYFPDVDYLFDVVKGAAAIVGQRGRVFVGDVRCLPLLEQFHTAIQLKQAPPSLPTAQLHRRAKRGMAQEEELAVDPSFFAALKASLPNISRVEIRLKRGCHYNEMSQYRYDAILHVGSEPVSSPSNEWLEWSHQKLTLDKLRRQLCQNREPALGISGVPNARVWSDVTCVRALHRSDCPNTVEELRVWLAVNSKDGVEPEDVWKLGSELGYEVDVSYARLASSGRFDVLFRRPGTPAVAFASESLQEKPWHTYTNNPLQDLAIRDLIPELRKRLGEQLPDYMVPSDFMVLDSLPLTPNGKVNMHALPEPEETGEHVAARTPIQEVVAGIWAEVLKLEQIGIYNDFFELGGHSLLATQVVSRVREAFQIEFQLRAMLDAPTVASMAQHIEDLQRVEEGLTTPPILPVSRDRVLPLSFAQQRLWLLDQMIEGTAAYNAPLALRISGPLLLDPLQESVNELIKRHEILRTTFPTTDDGPIQFIAPARVVPLELTDLSLLPKDEQDSEITRIALHEARQKFELATGPLFAVCLLRLSPSDHVLLWNAHHIITDGWTMGKMVEEMAVLYDAFASGKQSPLPKLPIQYADYAAWQRAWMQGEVLEKQLTFWKRQLAGVAPMLDVPTDHARPAHRDFAGKSHTIQIRKHLAEALKKLSQREGTTLFATMLVALKITLFHWTRQSDIVVGTVIANRNRIETENLLGCFMNFLPLRSRVSDEQTGLQLLEQVKKTVLSAYAHQDCPFEAIIEQVQPQRIVNVNALYNVTFLMQNFPQLAFTNKTLKAHFLRVGLQAAHLDLRFAAAEVPEGMWLVCDYATDLFTNETIAALLNSYAGVLEEFAQRPEMAVSSFHLMDELERRAAKARQRDRKRTIAVAATFTAEPLEDSVAFWMRELDVRSEIRFAPYNQVFQQLLDPSSLLGANEHGFNVILIRLEDWLLHATEDNSSMSSQQQLKRNAREFVSAVKSAVKHSSVPYLVCLCPASQAISRDVALSSSLRQVEDTLCAELRGQPDIYTVSSAEFLAHYPMQDYEDPHANKLGHIPYTQELFHALGTLVVRRMYRIETPPHRVVVLDCNQTLWKGNCADGPLDVVVDAPRRALQEFIIRQHNAGMLICLCGEGNEEDVIRVFKDNPGMLLRCDHLMSWRINGNSKTESLRSLAQELNLSLDSFILLDTDAKACAEIEISCPDVLTVQLPEEMDQLPHFLSHLWALDHLEAADESFKLPIDFQQAPGPRPTLGADEHIR